MACSAKVGANGPPMRIVSALRQPARPVGTHFLRSYGWNFHRSFRLPCAAIES
jgi:hypothetical protein